MAEPGKVKALRALFEKNAAKPKNPTEFESTRASIARHNLKFAARRASRLAQRPKAGKEGSDDVVRHGTTHSTLAETKAEWMTFGESDAFWLPELDTAINRDDDEGINKAVLKFFFEEHDPKRVEEVDQILTSNQGREDVLFLELSAQYPEPSMQIAFELVEAEKKRGEAQNWATFDDDAPILNGMRRPTGIWAVNFSPWDSVG
jgi:hypothetical protein